MLWTGIRHVSNIEPKNFHEANPQRVRSCFLAWAHKTHSIDGNNPRAARRWQSRHLDGLPIRPLVQDDREDFVDEASAAERHYFTGRRFAVETPIVERQPAIAVQRIAHVLENAGMQVRRDQR
jgi:hypothetical protein